MSAGLRGQQSGYAVAVSGTQPGGPALRGRKRRYFALMVPCLALVLFGFFVPAPIPVRVAALVIAAVIPPFAAIRGNG